MNSYSYSIGLATRSLATCMTDIGNVCSSVCSCAPIIPVSSMFTCQPPALCVMQTTVTTIVSYGFFPGGYDYRSA